MPEEIAYQQTKSTETQSENMPPWVKEITHSDKYHVRLHRTSKELAEKIMESGFYAGGDLASTTSNSGLKVEDAFEDFKRIHHGPNSVVIIRLPQRLFDEVNQNKKNASNNEAATGLNIMELMANQKPTSLDELMIDKFFDKDKGGIVVPKEWVFGYADQSTLELTKNPNYDPQLQDPTI